MNRVSLLAAALLLPMPAWAGPSSGERGAGGAWPLPGTDRRLQRLPHRELSAGAGSGSGKCLAAGRRTGVERPVGDDLCQQPAPAPAATERSAMVATGSQRQLSTPDAQSRASSDERPGSAEHPSLRQPSRTGRHAGTRLRTATRQACRAACGISFPRSLSQQTVIKKPGPLQAPVPVTQIERTVIRPALPPRLPRDG
ncbi:hypothetical protein SAMN02927929_00032 [Pseudomonas flexibilis]|nr:hypothetical protein SAMN02927929_00032 [Pseudomonas flexibilis]